MSMITEQVKRLRDAANRFDAEGAEPSDGDLMREAADTIEILSAKVQAANMERSTAYYNGGWIPVSERLPEKMGTYMTTVDYGMHGLAVGQRYYHGKGIGWEDDCVVAWMPLPEPYKGSEG